VGARDPGQCNFQWTSSTPSKRVEKENRLWGGVLDIDGTFTVTIATPDANRKKNSIKEFFPQWDLPKQNDVWNVPKNSKSHRQITQPK
jgi:hypothetical protein